ncbi:MAG: pyridoxal phosphate-dependent aminotransferase family protein [Pirellulales bacterium]|nr:pyridoxal phosphate-dependent aminotransferase family protein [Pirellulales bacterium]
MPIMQSPPGPYTVLDGKRYLYFSGTGYLGLQGHPEVIRAACEATQKYGMGSATSRVGAGEMPPLIEVEKNAAELFGCEDAFYFPSAYSGNTILALALDGQFDAVFTDERSHYSVVEAARLTQKPVHEFAHADPDDLVRQIKTHLASGGRPLVMSDGVFPGRGDYPPIQDYCRVLAEFPGVLLSIDDAHSVGVLGDHGRGTYEHTGVYDRGVNRMADGGDGPRLFFCGTMSKAFGGYGGIIPGDAAFIKHLKDTSTYFRGSNPPPAPAAAASARALRLVMDDPSILAGSRRNVAAVKAGLRELGLTDNDSPVAFVGATIGDADHMKRMHAALLERGIYVTYRATYSGLGAEGAIRIAVLANHTDEMITQLLDTLRSLV